MDKILYTIIIGSLNKDEAFVWRQSSLPFKEGYSMCYVFNQKEKFYNCFEKLILIGFEEILDSSSIIDEKISINKFLRLSDIKSNFAKKIEFINSLIFADKLTIDYRINSFLIDCDYSFLIFEEIFHSNLEKYILDELVISDNDIKSKRDDFI